jgi:hypothetical protein
MFRPQFPLPTVYTTDSSAGENLQKKLRLSALANSFAELRRRLYAENVTDYVSGHSIFGFSPRDI